MVPTQGRFCDVVVAFLYHSLLTPLLWLNKPLSLDGANATDPGDYGMADPLPSNYRPEPGSAGWSTRHLLAEQPDFVNELAERRQRDRINDKLSRLFNSELRERESGCSSTSIISL
jgi:hypothetical protein